MRSLYANALPISITVAGICPNLSPKSHLCVPRHKAQCLEVRANSSLGASSWGSSVSAQHKSDADILDGMEDIPYR